MSPIEPIPLRAQSAEENLKCIDKLYYSRIINESYQKYDIKNKLRIKFNENQTNLIYNKIIKRVRVHGPCQN